MMEIRAARGRRRLLIGAALLCTLGVVAVFHEPLLIHAAKWLNVGQRPHSADFVMILPGGEETRPFVAAELIRRGLAARVLLPRTVSSPAVDDELYPPTDVVIRRVLHLRGVPDERIEVLPGASTGTWSDMQSLEDVFESHPGATITIVTSDFHTRRSQWAVRKALGHAAQRVRFVSAPSEQFSPIDWWRSEAGLQTYLGEYAKLVVYLVRYGDGLTWSFLVACLVSVVFYRRRFRVRRSIASGEAYRNVLPSKRL